MTASQSGSNVILKGGVYTYDSFIVFGESSDPANAVIIYGEDNERPIITRSDDEAPDVRNGYNVTMYHVWFGGVSKTVSHTIQHQNDNKWLDCTVFGYVNQGINDGETVRNFYRRNRFVNCGSGTLYHSLYINYPLLTSGEGPAVEDNIFVGGAAYHIHLWHEPKYCVVRYNFCGDAVNLHANDGLGSIIDRNIFWSNTGNPALAIGGANNYAFRNNVFGPGIANLPNVSKTPTEVIDSNLSVDPTPFIGGGPKRWQEADVQSNFGASSTEIDNAITALETAFTTQTIAQIQADSTIETNFAVLKSVIDTWKTQFA